MNDNLNYSEQQNIKNTIKLREMINELPSFCVQYFRGIEPSTSPRTRIGYATDLKNFFGFVNSNINCCKDKAITDISLSDLDNIKASDIETYLETLKFYEKDNKSFVNHERSIKRKLCSIRSLYKYFHIREMIEHNPSIQVNMPKIHEKAIVRLDVNEVATLLDNVEAGNLTTKKQQDYAKKLGTRDLAILTLLLGTGIRVSECVGLDINDVDFDNARIKVVRKGGYESYVYFGDEVSAELHNYMLERNNIAAVEGHENALFLSIQKKRMCVRSIEKLVKKYSSTVTTVKKITPHKLRSTYGTALYQETKDIYLVADVLGHNDVNTTKKHYADLVDENRRSARNKVKLRED